MSKRLLMITRPFYPSNASGVHRSVANAKYLPEFGWVPIVICKEFTQKNSHDTFDASLARLADYCEVFRVRSHSNKYLDKLQDYIWMLFGGGQQDYRNPYVLYHAMKRAAERVLSYQSIDAIWSTFMPGIDHQVANYLCRKYSIPWVADFRDLPDQTIIDRNTRYVVQQEITACSCASALVAASEELADKLRVRHTAPVYTILNGYDPEDYYKKPTINLDVKFTISYFGMLYNYRDPSPIFAAIDILFREGKIDINDIEVNFYGANAGLIKEFSRGYECAPHVKACDRLAYNQMIEYQCKSQLLLLLAPPAQGGAIPAKLYSYLACHRPIINVPGDGGGTDRILQKTQAGISLSNIQDIALWLHNTYAEWKVTGKVSFNGIIKEIEQYSRKKQAEQLAQILDKICTTGNV